MEVRLIFGRDAAMRMLRRYYRSHRVASALLRMVVLLILVRIEYQVLFATIVKPMALSPPTYTNLAAPSNAAMKDDYNLVVTLSPDLRHLRRVQQSPYAYVFLLANCGDNKHRSYYRGFLYNVLVATRILRRSGAQADIIVMVQAAAPKKALPSHEEAWLQSLGCIVWYLPLDDNVRNFHDTQMLKFHLLRLEHYRRVLYLDADVMPHCSLDYLFALSDRVYYYATFHNSNISSAKVLAATVKTHRNVTLRPNVVLAWTYEPANGGFFLLQPERGDYARITTIIQQQRASAAHIAAPPYFNKTAGWGHVIQPPDHWEAVRPRPPGTHPSRRLWDFYAAYSDQGLLYHWVKYVKRDVTIILPGEIQTWMGSSSATAAAATVSVAKREKHIDTVRQTARSKGAVLRPVACLPHWHADRTEAGGYAWQRLLYISHPTYGLSALRHVPYNCISHFYGAFKPWWHVPSTTRHEAPYHARNAHEFWWAHLQRVDGELRMGLWRNGSFVETTVTDMVHIAAPRWIGVA